MRYVALLLAHVSLLGAPARAAVTLPDTPAAERLRGLIEVTNSGDAQRVSAYFEEYLPGRRLRSMSAIGRS